MRLIDIDEIGVMPIDITDLPYDRCLLTYLKEDIDNAPTIEAIPKDHIAKAIDKVEEYICDHEKDTVKAQGMAQALDIFEQELGGWDDEVEQ